MAADAPVAVLSDLETKREIANAEAEKHRRRRDELNLLTREWVEKRDALNAQVRSFVEGATVHRQKRDEQNAEVQAAKAERDKWNRRVNELIAGLNDVKRTKAPRGGIPVARLKREVRELEFRQQTMVLKPSEEKALIDAMGRLQQEIRKREKELEADEEVRKLTEELRTTRDTAEASHKRVGELAEAAQREHDAMVALFEQGDATQDGGREERPGQDDASHLLQHDDEPAEILQREGSHVGDTEDAGLQPPLPLVDHEASRLEPVVQVRVARPRGQVERRKGVRPPLGRQQEAKAHARERLPEHLRRAAVARHPLFHPFLQQLLQGLVQGVPGLHRGRERNARLLVGAPVVREVHIQRAPRVGAHRFQDARSRQHERHARQALEPGLEI